MEGVGVVLGLPLLIVLALQGTNILIVSIESALVVAATNSLPVNSLGRFTHRPDFSVRSLTCAV